MTGTTLTTTPTPPTSSAALPRTTRERQGIHSAALLDFVDAVERDVRDLHSLMLLRRGAVVAEGWWEPYGPRIPHLLFSLSKSFTSTAVGFLVSEGRLSVDDPVLGFFPGEAPEPPSDHLRALHVRHLLTMTAGHDADPTPAVFRQRDQEWTRAFLAQPLQHAPGTHFVYNTAATYMLSAIVQRITGTRLLDYLRPRLFEPLGIARPTWETSPQGIDVGGSGLSVTTEDIARFGQLYLQQGVWQGTRLLPAAWVADATAGQVPNGPSANPDWVQGYGYQFWRCRHGAYRGDGAFGQFCVVMPAQEAVLAITAGVRNMQQVLDLVWERLLPALDPSQSAPLPDNSSSQDALAARLAGLRLPPPVGQRTSPTAARVSGRTFAVAKNDEHVQALQFDFAEEGDQSCVLTIGHDRGAQRIVCGYGEWVRGTAIVDRPEPWKVAAAGAWVDKQTYVARLWAYETPFARTLTCRFEGDQVQVQQQMNVSFGSADRPLLEGQASAA